MNETLTDLLNKVFSILSIASIIFSLIIITIFIVRSPRNNIVINTKNILIEYNILFAWTIASLASIGSLFYSEISGFVPCTYCWYERIAMYPLVIILGVGLIIKNKPIKGSCGGLANVDESGSCSICGRSDPTNCSTQN